MLLVAAGPQQPTQSWIVISVVNVHLPPTSLASPVSVQPGPPTSGTTNGPSVVGSTKSNRAGVRCVDVKSSGKGQDGPGVGALQAAVVAAGKVTGRLRPR